MRTLTFAQALGEAMAEEMRRDPAVVLWGIDIGPYGSAFAATRGLYEEFGPEGPVCLVIGNEIEGVCADLTNHCDSAVEIEMMGVKNSLNVSVAFGIVAYHFRSCIKK